VVQSANPISGGGDSDADALTRELTMAESDLKALLGKNAVKNVILLMFANLGALQLLENYMCSLSEHVGLLALFSRYLQSQNTIC
jgi:hypothetical protein